MGVLKKYTDKQIFDEAKKRKEALHQLHGRGWSKIIWRVCKGCKKKMKTRELIAHKCSIPRDQR